MRKSILALLAAGALVFTASAAMASESQLDTGFTEKHYLEGTQVGATETIVPETTIEEGGNHYKKVDFVETGRHGNGYGGFQLNSAILKAQALELDGVPYPEQVAADDSWGYTTGNTPFVSGLAGGNAGENTDPAGAGTPGDGAQAILEAPKYTIPCPLFSLQDWNAANAAEMLGDCPANAFATDPQTDNSNSDPAVWDGTVLDDIYQGVGANDTSGNGVTTDLNGDTVINAADKLLAYGTDGVEGQVDPAQNKVHYRTFDQWLDQLFYNGKRGTIKTANGATEIDTTFDVDVDGDTTVDTSVSRIFNIDDTLDQDIADWEDALATSGENEIMGIYGKLTLLFQVAAPAGKAVLKEGATDDFDGDTVTGEGWVLLEAANDGCASLGSYLAEFNGPNVCDESETGVDYDAAELDGMLLGDEWQAFGEETGDTNIANLSAHMIDQWIVSDMWDTHPHRASDGTDLSTDKYNGDGVWQGYSSWFRDGSNKDFDYSYNYDGGHGKIDKTFTECGGANDNECHEHPDP